MSRNAVAEERSPASERLHAETSAEGASVAIVIPCFEVARHIAGVIRSIPQHYSTIICIDDGSRDGTAEVIAQLADPRVTVIRHPRNRGVGGAMKTGYMEALRLGAEICVKMDGDGQMSGEDLEELVAALADGTGR